MLAIEQQSSELSDQLTNQIVPQYPAITAAKARRYWQYFNDTYLVGQFPETMWSHFDTEHDRTNNRVEGDNNKMKLYCGAANPKIEKAIGLLKIYKASSAEKYHNAKKSTAHHPYKSKEQIIRDVGFGQAKNLLIKGHVTLAVYYTMVVDLYKTFFI
jgi:hypothetical protein